MRKPIIALTLREQDRNKVQEIAKQQERSVSEVLRRVIEDWLEKQKSNRVRRNDEEMSSM